MPGREIDWRLFPSGAKRNEGTAIRLPAVRRSFSLALPALPLKPETPSTWPSRNHTQVGRVREATLAAQVPRASRPQRPLLEFFVKTSEAGTHDYAWGFAVRVGRARYLYVIVRRIHRDAGGPFNVM